MLGCIVGRESEKMYQTIHYWKCQISYVILLFIILCFFPVQCSSDRDDSITGDEAGLVKVTIDMQSDFKGSVRIKINNMVYFSSILSGELPFAGPQASFTTYLSRGTHTMEVRYYGKSGTENKKIISFELHNAEEYYVGLRTDQEEELLLTVQEKPFGYV